MISSVSKKDKKAGIILPDPWIGQTPKWQWWKRCKNTMQEFQESLWNSCEGAVIKRETKCLLTVQDSLAVTPLYKLSLHICASSLYSMFTNEQVKFYRIKNRVIIKIIFSKKYALEFKILIEVWSNCFKSSFFHHRRFSKTFALFLHIQS